jgi:hypothetical protein
MNITPGMFIAIVGGFLALLVTLLIRARLDLIARQIATISRMEGKLDLLLKQAGLEYDPYKSISPRVVDLLKQGKKIEAIKCYREENAGVGLKDAKEYVEEVQRRGGLA